MPRLSDINHCTLWPDGFLGYFWGHCCAAHDIAYQNGPRLPADLELYRCVSEVIPVMGLIMFLGVSAFGGIARWIWNRRHRINKP